MEIKKEYIITANNQKRAVLIDINTFEKMEEIIENYGLGKYMEEIETEAVLTLEDAKKYYDTLTWS
ncbi:hypothetical protein M1N64_04055 [Peptococcaceae bacterium]|nr:hypothetical protein [Peptococcaceae bacterium]